MKFILFNLGLMYGLAIGYFFAHSFEKPYRTEVGYTPLEPLHTYNCYADFRTGTCVPAPDINDGFHIK